MDLVGQRTYTMVHIGQVSVPASLKDLSGLIDDMGVHLAMQKLFRQSFETLYEELRNPSQENLTPKQAYKRDTLSTPKLSRTHDCHRDCPFWFGRF